MARFWPKSRYNGRVMAREVFFYHWLWVNKFCAKFGCSRTPRTASIPNSFIVLRCMWKEPAPFWIQNDPPLKVFLKFIRFGTLTCPKAPQCLARQDRICYNIWLYQKPPSSGLPVWLDKSGSNVFCGAAGRVFIYCEQNPDGLFSKFHSQAGSACKNNVQGLWLTFLGYLSYVHN